MAHGQIKDSLAGNAVQIVAGLIHGADHAGAAGQDAREQDDGDAVADAELGDLLTQPHDKGGAGSEAQYDDDTRPPARQAGGVQHRSAALGADQV